MAEKFAKDMSLYKQDVSPTITSTILTSEDAKEQLLQECEEIWKQMEECQNKLTLQERETLPVSDPKLSLLLMRLKALTVELNQWQKRKPEIMTTNPDVLVAVGRDQLQKLDHDLQMVLSTLNAKNKNLKQNLLREQRWLEEQQQLIDCLNQTEEEISTQVVQFSEKRAFQELKSKMLKIKAYKDEISNALGEFLEEHFPLPENHGAAKKKRLLPKEPNVQLITLHEILESLIDRLINVPHDPYITISSSFWSPYIELLLRHGIALRHPEDPNRIRLENFYQ
ncbi:centromere protein K [Varanus komodoensis]|uniref:centromere protein K n=1 Tax=Varanus komodoensis TaxID=61221 RepID=UPI001CF7CCD1|nr:centromere protein K [Varanus komodoensis]